MQGHVSTSAGLIGSVLACVIGVFNSQGQYIPLPKAPGPTVRPTFDCGYALLSHTAREVVYPGPDWGVQVQCEIRNITGSERAVLRCRLPFAGALYHREVQVEVPRGTSQNFVFDFREPSFASGLLESLRSNDPDTGYGFEMEGVPSPGWNVMAWAGGAGMILFAVVLCSPWMASPFTWLQQFVPAGGALAPPSLVGHLVLTCSQCGQKLRLPKCDGTLLVTCPKCHHRFEHGR